MWLWGVGSFCSMMGGKYFVVFGELSVCYSVLSESHKAKDGSFFAGFFLIDFAHGGRGNAGVTRLFEQADEGVGERHLAHDMHHRLSRGVMACTFD